MNKPTTAVGPHGAPGSRLIGADGRRYVVGNDGALRRFSPKVKGKSAVKAHKRARRQRRLHPAIRREAQMEQHEHTQAPPPTPPTIPVPEPMPQGDGDSGTSEERTD